MVWSAILFICICIGFFVFFMKAWQAVEETRKVQKRIVNALEGIRMALVIQSSKQKKKK